LQIRWERLMRSVYWKAQSGIRAWPDQQPMSAEWRAAIQKRSSDLALSEAWIGARMVENGEALTRYARLIRDPSYAKHPCPRCGIAIASPSRECGLHPTRETIAEYEVVQNSANKGD
jgi:predicted RNA-binding Zn-ribbon protein involved in translation (DUF1610 family)